ncbi:MAG: protoporphyrinogen oxidase, partial [Actinobacteria bacterium]|nr:protoporphyrinogen oxidase [Actinomycetota bacterium]
PQYNVGHLQRVREVIEATRRLPHMVELVGAGYLGVGIPACIKQAKEAAERIVKRLRPDLV